MFVLAILLLYKNTYYYFSLKKRLILLKLSKAAVSEYLCIVLFSKDASKSKKQKLLQQASKKNSKILSNKKKNTCTHLQTKWKHLLKKCTIKIAWTNILLRWKTHFSNTLEITMVQTTLTMKLIRIYRIILFHLVDDCCYFLWSWKIGMLCLLV